MLLNVWADICILLVNIRIWITTLGVAVDTKKWRTYTTEYLVEQFTVNNRRDTYYFLDVTFNICNKKRENTQHKGINPYFTAEAAS